MTREALTHLQILTGVTVWAGMAMVVRATQGLEDPDIVPALLLAFARELLGAFR